MIEILLLAFAVYYFTQVLLFDEAKAGPFLSKKAIVAWSEINPAGERILKKRPVAFFDRFRRLFGLYTIAVDPDQSAVWTLKESRTLFWSCPHCLGFWVAFVISAAWFGFQLNFSYFFMAWFSTAGINSFLVRFHES